MKRIIIIGASSGIGYQIAQRYILQGCRVGIAARRVDPLEELHALAPDRVHIASIDVTTDEAPEQLMLLIQQMEGLDLLINSAGVGWQNGQLTLERELATAQVNVHGCMRVLTTAFTYFKQQGGGHIVQISSIAGTKGLGAAASYSATKCFQNCYLDALAQLSHLQHLNIRITDIRPGFVATPLLNGTRRYPMLMDAGKVADSIVSAIQKGRRIHIIDRRYAVIVFFWRLIPRWLWERLPIKSNCQPSLTVR